MCLYVRSGICMDERSVPPQFDTQGLKGRSGRASASTEKLLSRYFFVLQSNCISEVM